MSIDRSNSVFKHLKFKQVDEPPKQPTTPPPPESKTSEITRKVIRAQEDAAERRGVMSQMSNTNPSTGLPN